MGRSADTEIDIRMLYEGTNAMSVTGAYWTNNYPNKIEIFSEYQGIETGGIGLIALNAPAIPEPKTLGLLIAGVMLALRRACKVEKYRNVQKSDQVGV